MIALTSCQRVDTRVNQCQVLVLSPTRELAAQTEKTILAVGDFMNVQAHVCIGGKSVGDDIRKLENGVQVGGGGFVFHVFFMIVFCLKTSDYLCSLFFF